jgi:hypothetical protein
MHVAVTRQAPPERRVAGDAGEAPPAPPFLPDERIKLAEALQAFTRGSAFVNHLEHDTGSIEVGKLADLAVIDRNLFEVDDLDGGISQARVTMTLVEGDAVFEVAGS